MKKFVRATIFALLLINSSVPSIAQAHVDDEYNIKAAYLFRFITMVKWPSGSLPPEGGEIILGVFGQNPFGLALTPLNGKSVQGRTLRVREEISSLEGLKACHVVFVSVSEADRFHALAPELGASNLLTVSESEDFVKRGGVINFLEQRKKVRFEINPEAARRAGLNISSELLKLARIVKS